VDPGSRRLLDVGLRRGPRVSYATVIHEDGHPRRLLVATRRGDVVLRTRLATSAPDYETARAEAAGMYPDRTIVVPRLGESFCLTP
jgi:hypothetical protein